MPYLPEKCKLNHRSDAKNQQDFFELGGHCLPNLFL